MAADSDIGAIVVIGDGGRFSGGADIGDFGDDPSAVEPMRDLFDAIERSPKPIVMAVEGHALGGGLELAMAGHARIAAPNSTLGLPEVTLGLLPGGGGTQRLPRLIGSKNALEMMLTGNPISAGEALKAGLVDRISDGDLLEQAINLAGELSKNGFVPTRQRSVGRDHADSINSAKARYSGRKLLNPAPPLIIDCVEAAAGDFEAGLALEAKLFGELMVSPESKGLRHSFFAQRAASRIPAMASSLSLPIFEKAAVVGSGSMGIGISIALLGSDLPLVLIDKSSDALDRAVALIRTTFERDVARGRMSVDQSSARLARLAISTEPSSVADADIIIEAVFEDMEVKRDIFQQMDSFAKAGAVLASNTSTLDLDVIAGFTQRPEFVVGLHFFNPANVMKLLEIVRGSRTAPEVLAAAMKFSKRIGKVGVVAGVCDGFVGNRMFEEYLRQAYFLLEEGGLPAQLDTAMENWGMAMGPLRTMDLAGQDIGWSIRKRRAVSDPHRPYSKIPDLICEMGRFGQKTGAGYYRYGDGKPQPDPEIDALIRAWSDELGIQRRVISDAEIVDRCLFALVNEGARIVEEGIVRRPSDIDVVYVNGYGFPATRGGPMFHADLIGLPTVLKRIEEFAAGRHGWAWTPAPLLRDLVERGETLGSLNVR